MPLREPSYPPFYFDEKPRQSDRETELNAMVFELREELRKLKDGLAFMTGTGGPRVLRDAAEHWYALYCAAREHIIDYESFSAEAIDGIIATRKAQRTDADESEKPLTAVLAYLAEHL